MSNASKRVVITGIGTVCSLGVGTDIVWTRLIKGESGIRQIKESWSSAVDVKICANIPDVSEDMFGLNLTKYISPKDQRKMDRFIQLALVAADEALTQSNWIEIDSKQKSRTATLIGSSLGGFAAAAQAVRTYDSLGPKRLAPYTIPSFLLNLASGHISIKYGFSGPMAAPANACAASTQAIGDGYRMIQQGDIDVAVCGGSEACIDPVVLSGFVAARAVSTAYNDNPRTASRPFNSDRDGFVLGEGAAILVLEELEHALQRGAIPLAEIVGYGTTSEAYHITCCDENGSALHRSMKSALNSASLKPKDMQYVNAHGTSTPLGDRSELIAIGDVFGRNLDVAVSSTKSSIGHLLGAAGAIEAVFCIKSLIDQIIPPTLNLETPDALCDGILVLGAGYHERAMQYAMSNSAGFGGVNASLIFKRWS